jgi:hypothetical protein
MVNIAKVVVDITAEYSRSLHRDTSKRYIRQNIVGLDVTNRRSL